MDPQAPHGEARDDQLEADPRRGPSLFYLYAFLRPGVKPEDLKNAILEDVTAVQKDGITAQELEKARTQVLRAQIQSRQNDLGEAIRLSTDTVYFDDPNLINTALDKYDAVTADQIKSAAEKYLVADDRVIVTDLPAAKSSTQPGKKAQANQGGK